MRNLFFYLLFILLFIINSCDKEAVIGEKDYPYVTLSEINEINSEGINITAEIISLGKDSILDAGFIWDTSSSPTILNFRQSFTSQPMIGLIQEKITNCISEGVTYYIRPYIISSEHIVYGYAVSFVGLGSSPYYVNDFTPKEGKIGSEVTITGYNFNSNAKVYFGNKMATVKSSDIEKLVVEVPYLIDSAIISIHQNGEKIECSQAFNAIFPWRKINIPDKVSSLISPTGFSFNGKGYLFGGYDVNSSSYSKKVWEFDPSGEIWKQKSDFPGRGRENAVYFSINDMIYICFGDEGIGLDVFNELWEYDPILDIWSQKNDFPLSRYGSPICFSIEETGYIGLGLEEYQYGFGGHLSSKFWSYNPQVNEWKQIANFPIECHAATAFMVESSPFAGLGLGVYENSDFYKFDPIEDTWNYAFTYPGCGRTYVQNFNINGNVYIGFGQLNNKPCNDLWKYDSEYRKWTPQVDFPYSSQMTFGFSIISKGYFYDMNNFCFWEFDPAKN